MEGLGLEKEVDFVSCYIGIDTFKLPERIHRIAQRVMDRGSLSIKRFSSRRELKSWTGKIKDAYNRAFQHNWEFAPLTDREADFLMDNAIGLSDPQLIKIIVHGDEMVGFLFGFPDVSAALQRAKGRLAPWNLADLLLEMRRTKWLALNGAGLIPEFQVVGGNALLYAEMENTIRDQGFLHADLTQVAETAVQMRHDLVNLGKGVTYVIRVSNAGQTSHQDVAVEATLPAGMIPDRLGTSGPTMPAFQQQTVRFPPVAELAAGETLSYRVAVSPQRTGRFVFRAEVTSRQAPTPVRAEEDTEVVD